MKIVLSSLLDGATAATGTTVIIDVYRAFTTAAVAFQKGAEKIILVGEIENALDLKARGAGELCVGEVGGIKPKGFDLGNSPFELSNSDLEGKTLIQSTRAGTVGVETAANADLIYGGSLAVARATAEVILRDQPDMVSLVAMGWEGKDRTDEDELCGIYLRNLLQGLQPDREAVHSLVLGCKESQKFDNPDKPHFHPGDRDRALDIDSVPFAIKIKREDGLLVARPETP